MQSLFDTLNAWLTHHPDIMAHMRLLFWLKSWLLFILMGVFLVLIYRENRRQAYTQRDADHHLIA